MVKFRNLPSNHSSDLPTVANLTTPNPSWNANNSFDYRQYLNKKVAKNQYHHAASKPLDKPDTSFKVESKIVAGNVTEKFFYNFTDYNTRTQISKIYRDVHPYCNLINNAPNTVSGENIFDETTFNNIAGYNSDIPIVENQEFTPTRLNHIKGKLQIDNRCVNFMNGFRPSTNYNYTFNY